MKLDLNFDQLYILRDLGFNYDFVSLQDALELLPKVIKDTYEIYITYCKDSPDQKWNIAYIDIETGYFEDSVDGRNELIDCIFDWLVYLKRNNLYNESKD